MKDYICTDHGRCIISGWEVASVTLTTVNGSFMMKLIEIKSIFTLLNFVFFFKWIWEYINFIFKLILKYLQIKYREYRYHFKPTPGTSIIPNVE